jgi:Rod binding domain-containing protein
MDVSTNIWNVREQIEKGQRATSINHTLGATRGHAKPTRHEMLEEQTRKWVAQSFFGPILKQMRDDPFHSDLLDGGEAGKAFYEMYDQELTNHLTRGVGSKIVDAIVSKIEAKRAYAKYGMSKLNQEREGADRVHLIRNSEANLSVATRSNDVATAF